MKHKIIEVIASILVGLWFCSALLIMFLGVVDIDCTKESEVLNTIFIISQNIFLITTLLALIIITILIIHNIKLPKINLKIKKNITFKKESNTKILYYKTII